MFNTSTGWTLGEVGSAGEGRNRWPAFKDTKDCFDGFGQRGFF